MLFIVAGVILALDQLSKFAIRAILGEGASFPVIDGIFSITHVRNSGAAFGLFPDQPIFLVSISLFIIVAILTYYFRGKPTNPWIKTALGLELGGAVGNLVDRVINGRVTDFLDLNKLWPVFNLADSAIVVGAVILVSVLLLSPDSEHSLRKVGD